ncbi:hypothetical protein OQ496_11995 [Acetobacter suratthaniensis]|uniref:MFS transporter n=1 Tax=Acetobacter suratthaniensis TaxID=1502841 RepID=A0ABS3LP20_9PROT|nr:hypothetical protein [Acetobacter suratthaniensis]MBO1329129.1 hypothetical protein [Acetobacter suratthaniensis]MCX2567173.1 hypothetical protein [Acetobacter suratthaniensis]
MTQRQDNRPAFFILAAVSAVDCAAHSMNSLGPFAVGELVRSGRFSLMQAGLWSCVEMLSYAIAMTGIAPWSSRLRLRSVAFLAASGLIVAQTGSAFAHALLPLMLLRVLSGFSLGSLNAVVNIGASRLGKPVFVLSFVMVVQTIVFSMASLLLPHAATQAGQKGVFLVLAGMICLTLPFMAFLPGGPILTLSAPSPSPRLTLSPRTSYWALLAVLFYTGGSLAVWPFTERIGASVGLHAVSFGKLSAVSNVVGLLTCLITAWSSRKQTVSPLLIPAILLIGGVCIIQAYPTDQLLFCSAFIINYAAWFFIYPSLVGVTCLVDPSGKLASRAGGAWMFSQTATTFFASVTQTDGHYLWTGLFSFALCGCAAGATLKVTRARHKKALSQSGPYA